MKEGKPGAPASTRRIGIVCEWSQIDTTLARQRAANFCQLRRWSQVEQIWRLGPRVTFELIEELIRHGLVDAADLDGRLAAYAAISPTALLRAGGHRFAPPPLRLAAGGRS